jgi:hypothetical protein
MNFFLKQRFWFFIAVFFMVVTITLLACLWRGKGKHNKHKSDEDKHHGREINEGKSQGDFNLTDYLAEQLAFSAEQKQKLAVVNDMMEAVKDSLSEQNEISKDLFSKELYAYMANRKKQDSLITCMSNFTQAFNKTRIAHIDKIKAICNEEQKKKLGDALSNLNGFNFKRKHHHSKHH